MTTLFEKGIDLRDPGSMTKYDQSIQHALINHVDITNLRLIDRPSFSGASMWKELVSKYESNDPLAIEALKNELGMIHIGRGDAHAYLAKIQSVISQLRARGEFVSEAGHIQQILSGLTPEYDAVIAYTMNPVAEQSVEIISRYVINVHRAHALQGRATTRTTRSLHVRNTAKCNYCKRVGLVSTIGPALA